MPRKALPVYLNEAQHEALARAARRTGRPMTRLIRDLIDDHLGDGGPPTDLSELVGAVSVGRVTDIGSEKDSMLIEAAALARDQH